MARKLITWNFSFFIQFNLIRLHDFCIILSSHQFEKKFEIQNLTIFYIKFPFNVPFYPLDCFKQYLKYFEKNSQNESEKIRNKTDEKMKN